jgi:O-acetyl-ADP-ribose deacetylase
MRRVGIVLGDISRLPVRVGAIVTSSNKALSGNQNPSYWRFSGRTNVDGAVRAAAGVPFVFAKEGYSLNPGDAIVTDSVGQLREFSSKVIHTNVPEGEFGSDAALTLGKSLLSSCYFNALTHATSLESIAFPALGCGVRGWKPSVAAEVAFSALSRFASLESSQLRNVLFVFHAVNTLKVFEAVAIKTGKWTEQEVDAHGIKWGALK